MSTYDRSIVTGVFQEDAQAQQAMADLQNAGFTADQIRYSVHSGGAGIFDSLTGLGLGQDEANYYNSEFMAGRTIVIVKTNDRQQEAYDILHRYNAYDWNSPISQGAGTASTANANTQTPPTGYQTAQAGSAAAANAYDQTTDQGPRKMQLREEQLYA